MKWAEYNAVVATLDHYQGNNAQSYVISKFPHVDSKTLGSIYSQEIQRKVKKNFHRFNAPDIAQDIFQSYINAISNYEAPGILVRMSKELTYSPAMLSKLILEQHLNATKPGTSATRSQVNRLLRDTTLIEDRDLAYEVYLCLLEDDVYGPFADSIKHSIGHEYEFLLKQQLDALNISYQNEDDLRSKGYDKTPDIKLDIPIAVDGRVINWIESKASFGDRDSHKTYLKDQFWSYWNRFGAGLVIYWFGFIEELDEHKEKGIMLRDSFPKNITYMDPLSLLKGIHPY